MPTITAVILNWRRFDNIQNEILPRLSCIPDVTEIIIANNNVEDQRRFSGSKVNHIKGNRDLGLDARFIAALLAKSEFVLLQDDDLCLPEGAIHTLMGAAFQQPRRIHCCFGRNARRDNTYAENIDRKNATVDIALTRALVIRRALLYSFFQAREFGAIIEARMRFLEFDAHPENGEDIILSYAVRKATGLRPLAHETDIKELPTGRVGLSELNLTKFRAHRTLIMRAAQQYLSA